jgi:hypothetical protein
MINVYRIQRVIESVFKIIPGLFVWVTLVLLVVFSFTHATWVAYFIIVFDMYWFIKAIHLSFHLVSSYRHFVRNTEADWNAELASLKDIPRALSALQTSEEELRSQRRHVSRFDWRRRAEFLQRIKFVTDQIERIQVLAKKGVTSVDWMSYYHVLVLPTYHEELSLLEDSVRSIVASTFPLRERMIFVLATEERDATHAQANAAALEEKFGNRFLRFVVTIHPADTPGEAKVKGANVTYALREVKKNVVDALGLSYDKVIVSVFDADTQPSSSYFSTLTFFYATAEKPTRTSYQPIPMYDNNLNDTPALLRVVSVGTSFWYMIESSRPDRLCTFSSHSMSLKALVDVDYYPVNVVSDDSRIFYRAFLHYGGDYRVDPMFISVSMDAMAKTTFFQTMRNQYKQIRRWAWGIENVPYLISNFFVHREIPLRRRVLFSVRLLESNFTWATTALIITFVGWLPLFFGGEEFEQLVISETFLLVAQVLTTIAMFGLFTSIAVNLLLSPRRQHKADSKWYITVIQWFLLPVTTIIFGSLPAIDAQTRMMVGDDLGFNVTPKRRQPVASVTGVGGSGGSDADEREATIRSAP